MTNIPKFNVAEAKARFSELIRLASEGHEVIIARDNRPILKLVPIGGKAGKRSPGTGRGQILSVLPDFDETPPGFDEHLP